MSKSMSKRHQGVGLSSHPVAWVVALAWLLTLLRPGAVQAEKPEAPATPMTLRAGTWNLRAGEQGTPEKIGAALKPLELDVVALSETPGGDWPATIGKAVNLPHVFVGSISSANHRNKFKAVLSRWPIVAMDEFELKGAGWQPASAVRVELDVQGQRLAVYSLHLPGVNPSNPARGAWEDLADRLAQEKVTATLVMGDFNQQRDDAVLKKLAERGWRATWSDLPALPSEATTYVGSIGRPRVIDHVLYRAGAGLVGVEGGIFSEVPPLSDHLPVWAKLQWTANPPRAVDAAAKAKERDAAIQARLRDPSLMAPGAQRVYRGENLTGISFPVGGIGAGMIQFDGNGVPHAWQIFNNFEHIAVPQSLMAIRAITADGRAVVRALRTAASGELTPMSSVSFRGEYPLGWYDFEDPQLPVAVSMELFNPLVPMHEKESSMPCAIWTITLRNPSDTPVQAQLLAAQENVTGFGDRIRPRWQLPKDHVVLAEFEGADWGNWTATGDAFSAQPTQVAQAPRVSGAMGKGVVHSGMAGDQATGTLTSAPFTIEKRYLSFLIAGGNLVGRTGVNLLVNDRPLRRATGRNSNGLAWHTWDVANLKGRTARIQIIDNVRAPMGRILADHFIASDEALTAAPELFYPAGRANRIVRQEGTVRLHMTTPSADESVGAGDMTLLAWSRDATATPDWQSATSMQTWMRDGALPRANLEQAQVSDESALRGALSVPVTVLARGSAQVRLALTWHFPNVWHGSGSWGGAGNRYTQWWNSSAAVADELQREHERLRDMTLAYHATMYDSNLPRWLLDRVSSQVAVLRSKTCFWQADGYFGGWEGSYPYDGSWTGNVTHVWHYAQAHARLFPSIARRLREQALATQRPDGGLPHRQPTHLPVAFDGQCGEILGTYREHLLSVDGAWLKERWPAVKKAMNYLIDKHDPDEDGVLAGPQWNTLDNNLGGSSTWLGSLYLAALDASQRMATQQGDSSAAQRYAAILKVGPALQDRALFNGEYFIQKPDPQPYADYLDGCMIDQVLGEWWSAQLGMSPIYPREHVRSALRSLVRYNFQPDFRNVVQEPRNYVHVDDAGMQVVIWPRNPPPAKHLHHHGNVMTGFEYAAAAAMIQAGLHTEGLMVAKAIADRYDGRLRTGLTDSAWGYSGNPFGDDEAGKFYVRAMSSWSLLLAAQGFVFDGPAGVIGFGPAWNPQDHRSFFTTAAGYGTYAQKRREREQVMTLHLRFGELTLRSWRAVLPEGVRATQVTLQLKSENLAIATQQDGGQLSVNLSQSLHLKAGETLMLSVKWD